MAGDLWSETPEQMKKAFPAVGESLMANLVNCDTRDDAPCWVQ